MKKLLIVICMLFALPLLAMNAESVDGILAQLTPLLNTVAVFLAIEGSKFIKRVAPAWVLGLLVPGFSTLGAWIVTQISPDSSFLITLLLGFLSTFVYELYGQLSGKKKKAA